MLLTAKDVVWWPRIETDIRDLISKCTICLSMQNKPATIHNQFWSISIAPLERIHLKKERLCRLERNKVLNYHV